MTNSKTDADLLAQAFRTLQGGDAAAALTRVRERLDVQPDDVRGLSLQARAHAALGDLAAARASVDRALTLDADSLPALVERAALVSQAGDQAALRATLVRMIQLAPGVAAFRFDLAMLDLAQGRYDEASAGLEVAARLRPRWIEPMRALGAMRLKQREPKQAIEYFGRCLLLDRDDVSALEGMGDAQHALGHRGDFQVLIDARLRVAALRPDSVDALFSVAIAYRNVERFADAAHWFDRVLALDPDLLPARWARFQHPESLVHNSAIAEAAFLVRWREGLAYFERAAPMEAHKRKYFGPTLTNATNFYLHYLGEPFLDEQRRHAAVVQRMARELLPDLQRPLPKPAPRDRMRVGFVSCHLRRHTITKLMSGFILGLDRDRFEVCAFHADDREDAVTAELRSRVDRFESGERDPGAWARLLHGAGLDALVYLDIGMDPTMQVLASLRIAHLQCALWGHPVTSGFEHIDWFLSVASMETTNGPAHYHERLALLPGIGTCYQPPARAPDRNFVAPARQEPGTVHYLFAQSSYKIRPLHDDLLARIAERVPSARFSMVPSVHAHVRDALAVRLRTAFAARGLDLDRHVRILPYLSEERFLALARDADLNLDSIGWSGGNTTIEITWFDVPTITLPGPLMRSRHSAAMMRAMGLDELVVADTDAYVDLAVTLGLDRDRREALRARVRERKHLLYDDQCAIEAFSRFLREPSSLAAR